MIIEGQFKRKKGDSLRLPSANGYVGNADNLFSIAQNHKFPSDTHTFGSIIIILLKINRYIKKLKHYTTTIAFNYLMYVIIIKKWSITIIRLWKS